MPTPATLELAPAGSSRAGRSPSGRALLALVAFALLYNVSFQAFEEASTARVAVLLLALLCLLRGRALYEPTDPVVLLVFLPLPVVVAQSLMSGDLAHFSRFANLALYAYLGANMFARLVGDLDELLAVLLAAVTLQALIILFSFVSLDYRLWVEAHVATGSNVSALNPYRAPGLGSGGSALSVVQALGVLAGGLLLVRRRAWWGGAAPLGVLLQMLLCLLSCVFVGRTGLLLSLLFLVGLCAYAGALTRLVGIALLGVVVPIVWVGPAWVQWVPDSFSLDFFVDWAFGFFLSGRDESLSDLATMPVPPLNLETAFGTGLVSLNRFGNPSGHDSGFVQAYFAMGLPTAILFYAAYAVVLWRLVRWLPLALRLLVAVPLFAIEAKEPFVFKYSVMIVLVAAYTLAPRGAAAGSAAAAR